MKTLLPHQVAGIKWLEGRTRSLLADEMGLGKTAQAIVAHHKLDGPTLVVAPATLLSNWENEIGMWAPGDKTQILDSGKAKLKKGQDWVICSYNLIEKHGASLAGLPWHSVVLDEAHYIKNPKARRSKALHGRLGFKLNPSVRLAMTGTPVLNRPIDIYSPLRWLKIPDLPEYFWFARRYCAAWNSPWGLDVSGASNTEELHRKLTKTCMLRRTKTEVLKDLPAKFRQLVVLNDAAIEKAVAAEYRALGDDEKYQQVLLRMRGQENMTVVFDSLAEERQRVAMAKLPASIDYINQLLESKPKVVLFAHHKCVMDALKAAFPDAAVIVGDTPVKRRQQEVNRFQQDPKCRVFIGNIQAAGVGITLTAADTVVFLELDWVPANMSQAEDRLHRIGQLNCVTVIHLVASKSLDSHIAQQLIDKQNTIDSIVENKE